MKRYLFDIIIEWKKDNNRKPLIIEGARQVGKTWWHLEFSKRCYERSIDYFNYVN